MKPIYFFMGKITYMTLTPERIEEIRERLEAATKGPWRFTYHRSTRQGGLDVRSWAIWDEEGNRFVLDMTREGEQPAERWDENRSKDFELIAHAPQDISDLLSAYDALSRGTSRPINDGELLPCPFCGSDAFIIGPVDGLYRAQCKSCGTSVGEFKTRKECAPFWNRRALSRDGMQEALVKARDYVVYSAGRSIYSTDREYSDMLEQIDAALSPDAPKELAQEQFRPADTSANEPGKVLDNTGTLSPDAPRQKEG